MRGQGYNEANYEKGASFPRAVLGNVALLRPLEEAMTVYVDALVEHPKTAAWRYVQACHMWADSIEELHVFAKRIGLKRAWFQNSVKLPHYDLTARRRASAIKAGAVQARRRDYFRRLNAAQRAQQALVVGGARVSAETDARAREMATEWIVELGKAEQESHSVVVMMPSAQAVLAALLAHILEEGERLKGAIKAHHDQRADDRCHLDDEALYAAAGLEPADVTLPPREKFLENCARFYERRCVAGDWPSYQELEARLQEAEAKQRIDEQQCDDMTKAAGELAAQVATLTREKEEAQAKEVEAGVQQRTAERWARSCEQNSVMAERSQREAERQLAALREERGRFERLYNESITRECRQSREYHMLEDSVWKLMCPDEARYLSLAPPPKQEPRE